MVIKKVVSIQNKLTLLIRTFAGVENCTPKWSARVTFPAPLNRAKHSLPRCKLFSNNTGKPCTRAEALLQLSFRHTIVYCLFWIMLVNHLMHQTLGRRTHESTEIIELIYFWVSVAKKDIAHILRLEKTSNLLAAPNIKILSAGARQWARII